MLATLESDVAAAENCIRHHLARATGRAILPCPRRIVFAGLFP